MSTQWAVILSSRDSSCHWAWKWIPLRGWSRPQHPQTPCGVRGLFCLEALATTGLVASSLKCSRNNADVFLLFSSAVSPLLPAVADNEALRVLDKGQWYAMAGSCQSITCVTQLNISLLTMSVTFLGRKRKKKKKFGKTLLELYDIRLTWPCHYRVWADARYCHGSPFHFVSNCMSVTITVIVLTTLLMGVAITGYVTCLHILSHSIIYTDIT